MTMYIPQSNCLVSIFNFSLKNPGKNIKKVGKFYSARGIYLIVDGSTTCSTIACTTTYQAADIAIAWPDGIPGPVSHVEVY